MKLDQRRFIEILFKWCALNKREFSWRKTKDPYAIWVSEIMLQQTQTKRVEVFYDKFLRRFPTVQSLASAPWKEVLHYWQGLGYYRRARSLHAGASKIMTEYSGEFPSTFAALRFLPGVGIYTAAAIASFAFGEAVAAIDTNADEVFAHVFGVQWKKLKPREKFSFASSFVPPRQSAQFNHAMMDFGAFLKNISTHELCPFHLFCSGILPRSIKKNAHSFQETAVRKNIKSIPYKFQKCIKVAAGVLIYEGNVLITQRKNPGHLGGYWEFPGGKLEAGEDQRSCLKREMYEELGIQVSVRPPFHTMDALYEGVRYKVSFHRCSLLDGEPKALQVADFRWVKPADFIHYNFLPSNKDVLKIIQKKKAMLRV